MSEIKIFKLHEGTASELVGTAMQVERSLQNLFEKHLDVLLGVRLLASEYFIGSAHAGRIDTLGLDEDGSPVIIEYKRATNENVVSQGLFYFDWLMDHRKEFLWLVSERFGSEIAKTVDWSAPRLLCIAGDYTRYDQQAVKQIDRAIELLRYKKFGDDLLMIDLVNVPKVTRTVRPSVSEGSSKLLTQSRAVEESIKETSSSDPYADRRQTHRLGQASPELRGLYDSVVDHIMGFGDDIQVKELKQYTAFERLRNFACLEIFPTAKLVVAFLRVNPDSVMPIAGVTRDVRRIGHSGTGDLEVSLRNREEFDRAASLFQLAYAGS